MRKEFGDIVALDGVDLDVFQSECVALVGESGSGKTTLLRCFNRMMEPDSGEVLVNGRNVHDVDPIQLRRATGYVQQSGGLIPHWSVRRNAAMVPSLRGADDADELAAASLERVGMPVAEFGDRWPNELSGGQRQRVALARALADEPSVLLLDEPFGALDAITRSDLQRTFDELRRSIGITVLLVTHDMREATTLSDRIAVMRNGSIEQFAESAEIMSRPATEYVSSLVQRSGIAGRSS